MIAITFSKERAMYILDCLRDGKPIAPASDAWTGNDMLALAGACFFGVMSQGPESFWLKAIDVEHIHPERREMADITFNNDLHAAVECYGQLAMSVEDHEFDDQYGPDVWALVSQQGDVERKVQPMKGWKGHPDVI